MFRRLFQRSEFNRNVFTMLTGTSVAQAIPILISPILTRLYSPAEFGVFAIYLALASVLVPVSTGRYELSIILPKDDEDARSLVLMVLLIAASVAAVVFGVMTIWSQPIAALLNSPAVEPWLMLLPVSVVVTGAYMAMYYYNNRHGRFQNMSLAQITQSGTTALTNLALGATAIIRGGLIIGAVVGQVASTLLLFGRTRGEFVERPTLATAWNNAKRYRKFPGVQLPATFVETLSAHAPTVLLSSFFGPVVVGLYALSQRVVRMPIGVIGSAVTDVFRQRAGRDYTQHGDARQTFRETFAKLALVSVIPFIIFVLTAPWLFAMIFGADWRTAGEYAQILAPMFWLSFMVGPVSSMFMIAQKQEYDLALQLFLITGSITALVVGFRLFESPKAALALFTGVYCLKYLVEFFLAYSFTLNRSVTQ